MHAKSAVHTERPERKAAGGRPPKFAEASRPVTVTLPDRILRRLAAVSQDRARAIVKCVEAAAGAGGHPRKAVELVEVAPGKALIMVAPSLLLRRIPWLRLAEIAPARYLLVLPSGTAVEQLEVALADLVEDLPDDGGERSMIEELRSLLGKQRRRRSVTKAELVFVDIH